MFYDLHCHLTDRIFATDRDKVVSDCLKNNIVIVLNGLDYNDNTQVLELAAKYSNIRICLGMHPTNNFDERVISQIRENKDRIIGIGEVGLDFKQGLSNEQVNNFKKMIILAESLNKPLIVHSRKAEKEVLDLVKTSAAPVVLHAFFAGRRLLSEALASDNVFFSVPASVSYDTQLQELVEKAPVERLFCETDSPYLWKFGRNTPLNVLAAYDAISRIKKLSLNKTEEILESNYKNVFLKR